MKTVCLHISFLGGVVDNYFAMKVIFLILVYADTLSLPICCLQLAPRTVELNPLWFISPMSLRNQILLQGPWVKGASNSANVTAGDRFSSYSHSLCLRYFRLLLIPN